MTDHASFLAAILAAPDDDAPRLLYADWLDEHGECDRAAFILAQCELAKTTPFLLGACDVCGNEPDDEGELEHGRGCYVLDEDGGGSEWAEKDPRYEALRYRQLELLYHHEQEWIGQTFAADLTRQRPDNPHVVAAWEFRRGFVESVIMSAAALIAHGDELVKAAPIREVTLTTWPDYADNRFAQRGNPAIATQGLRVLWPSIRTWNLPSVVLAPTEVAVMTLPPAERGRATHVINEGDYPIIVSGRVIPPGGRGSFP